MQAYKRAIHLLSIKARFRKELEERLRQEGLPNAEIREALEKCARFFNDEELAQSKAQSKAKKGYGLKYISASLHPYGVATSEIDEKQVLINYLKKHPKLLTDPKAKLRLLRRGFSYETIEQVLKISSE